MELRIIESKNLKWVNIIGPDEKALKYLKDNYKFHALDLEDISEDSQRPKIDTYKYYLFLILHLPELDKEKGTVSINQIAAFVGDDYLITIQKKKLKPLEQCFSRCKKFAKVRKEFFGKNSGYLLYKILESLFDSCLPVADFVGKRLDEVESQVFEGEAKLALRGLADCRRNVLTFRRMIDPQRFVINVLSRVEKIFLPSDLGVYFDDIHDSIEKTWAILVNYKDVIDGLHNTNESLISYKTNAVIKVLTVISAALLPLTLITGVFGMNIRLPFAGHPFFVWTMMGLMVLSIVFVILYFKKKDWL